MKMNRRDELLDRAVGGTLTKQEAQELKVLIQDEKTLGNVDERIRMLIIFGVGAMAGYALPKLLELGQEDIVEVKPEPVQTQQSVQPQRRRG